MARREQSLQLGDVAGDRAGRGGELVVGDLLEDLSLAIEDPILCAEIAREVDRDKDHRAPLCVTHVCARVQAAGGAVAGRGDSGEAEEAAVALLATSVEQARPDPHLILPPGYSADTI